MTNCIRSLPSRAHATSMTIDFDSDTYYILGFMPLNTLAVRTPTIKSDRTLAVVSFPEVDHPGNERSRQYRKNVVQNENDNKNGAKNVLVNMNCAKTIPKDGTKTTPLQKAILSLMVENPTISLDQIAKAIGIGTALDWVMVHSISITYPGGVTLIWHYLSDIKITSLSIYKC